MASDLSSQELKSFHTLDRDLYSRLVQRLGRDPTHSLWAMALWLWLEEMGYPSIILNLHSLPDGVVLEAFAEALLILDCINSGRLSTYTTIPRTSTLMDENITLHLFHDNSGYVSNGIIGIVTEVCDKVFDDIMREAIKCGLNQNAPILIPGAHEGRKCRHFVARDSTSPVAQSDCTMFMTFSKGYPVSEQELRAYLMRSYGDVVDEIQMEKTPPEIQPLYARVIFRSPSAVAKILNGHQRVKFVIKGKHVYTRRSDPSKHLMNPRIHLV